MADHPALMSAPMVRATIREARKPGTGKTETRRLLYTDRVAKNGMVPGSITFLPDYKPDVPEFGHYWTLSTWQRVKAGDRLWVRECHSLLESSSFDVPEVWYWADGNVCPMGNYTRPRPSIHLHRCSSRLTLIVTSTKIERLQDITEDDARAEGVEAMIAGPNRLKTYRTGFVSIWTKLHGKDSWLDNPWIVAISFKPILANIDAI